MAKQQGGPGRSQEREPEGGNARGGRGGSEAAGAQSGAQRGEGGREGAGAQGAQGGAGTSAATGMQGGGTRGDQERQRTVEREGGSTGSGAGMQRRGSATMGGGSSLSGRGEGEGALLPAFMANPGLMASAFMSNPFAFAQAMSQEMDRLFSSLGPADPGTSLGRGGSGRGMSSGQSRQPMPQGGRQGGRLGQWIPPLEVRQRGNELVVCADLPGLSPDDVDIDVEDGVLTISGERQQSNEDRQENYYRSERSYGSFVRSIPLPEGVNEEEVRAHFDNGVLEVTIPIPEQRARGRRIEIQRGSERGASRTRAEEAAEGGAGRRSTGEGTDIRPGEVGA